jgi:hypothetical protein
MVLLENRGDATFIAGDVDDALSSALPLGAGDFDGDHDVDIPAGSYQSDYFRLYDM